jgi:acetate kinase
MDSRVSVMVTRTNEACMIAQEVRQLLESRQQPAASHRIPIAVSARHVHLSHTAVEQLFGPGHQLTLERVLAQKDGWAAKETVELIGPQGSFQKVRVLGRDFPH